MSAVAVQLSLFDLPPGPGGDLAARLRPLLIEPDMTAAEVEAVVADALAELDWTWTRARAKPCRCVRRLLLDEGRCHWCGRAAA